MSRGSKALYTEKQKRQAQHIEESYEERGASKPIAEKRAWQTVNKQTGGGEKSDGGRQTSAQAKQAARSRKISSSFGQKISTHKETTGHGA